MKRESHGNAWHPCQYVDCKLEHDGSWVDGRWYEWEDIHGSREVARMKLDAIDHFYPYAKIIKEGLKDAGYNVSGGVNAPYIWLETPKGMTSWDFFDYLLDKANVVGTPGSGFGPSGEGYFRLTAFGSYENTLEAIERIKAL